MSAEHIQQAAQILAGSRYAVALTGAGISTPSGIPDFRSMDSGLWQKHNPLMVASLMGFTANPAAFYDWVAPLADTVLNAQPNPAHLALARLEKLGKLQAVVTQNIDMLHSRAGSSVVHEVHGHLRQATCLGCGRHFPGEPLIRKFLADAERAVLRCEVCGNVLKPDVILFGEALPAEVLNAAEAAAQECDVMLIAGSSLEVYPVADLPRVARSHGAQLIIVNFEPTPYDSAAAVVIRGDVAEVLPLIVDAVEAL